MSATAERVRDLVAPLLTDPDVVLYDVEHTGGTLRIVIDREGGVDLGTITEVTRAVSAALDDADLLPGAYTLEVSSPGLERALRTPEHFSGAVGREVRIKLRPGTDGDRRAGGVLTAADDRTVTVVDAEGHERVLRIDDITKANVHVDWSPPPKPGSPASKGTGSKGTGSKGTGSKGTGSKGTGSKGAASPQPPGSPSSSQSQQSEATS